MHWGMCSASPGFWLVRVAAGALGALVATQIAACGSDGASDENGDGAGGASNGGAATASGGETNGSGGARAGGASSTGGRSSSSGGENSGGSAGTGGANTSGGTANTGGGKASGGASNTGGGKASGGASNTGGGKASGGASNTGGGPGTGGSGNPTACPGTKPDATNTGVPSGVSLTVVNGDVTVSADDTIIDAQDIHGFLIIKASRVRVTHSMIRGRVATANGAGIRVQSGTDILIEDTEVALANPSAYLDGISGANFTVRRANVHGGVDGMKVGSNSTVECSYIHDLASFDSDPNQGGGPTHNDAIQILSGTGIHIVGNQLVAAKDQNAGIQVTQDFGAVGDLHIESNWADGGGCTFNFAHKGGTSLSLSATGNRFGRNSSYGCPILKSTQTTLTSSGNVYDDDGSPVPIQTHD
jgi:hypothetical protein